MRRRPGPARRQAADTPAQTPPEWRAERSPRLDADGDLLALQFDRGATGPGDRHIEKQPLLAEAEVGDTVAHAASTSGRRTENGPAGRGPLPGVPVGVSLQPRRVIIKTNRAESHNCCES